MPDLRSPITDLQKKRYIELDLLRSAAVIGMIVYHAAYDLQMFRGWPIDVERGYWIVFERIVALTFLLLVGMSFAISWDRTDPKKRWRKFLTRGLIVIGCGCLVSIATYIVDPLTFVRFGVLQLIGTAILLLPLFARFKVWNLLIAAVIIGIHHWIARIHPSNDLLLPFGLISPTFQSVDYFPLIPWFGAILMGLVIGQTLYVDHLQWRFRLFSVHHLPTLTLPSILISILTFPSRYALIIYLLHQPILMLLIRLLP